MNKRDDIAIIGMSCRFPKAGNPQEFWNNLMQGLDCISEVPKERWDIEKYYSKNSDEEGKTYSRWGGFIDDAHEFDPVFFNVSPKEAVMMDPQQRKVLEVAYEAIENAGYSALKLEGSDTGVFLGVMGRGYFDQMLSRGLDLEGHLLTSSLLGFTANRISFHLNLKGPSVVLDTLCSSSLVAVHQACQSIWNGECDMSLAGGVYIHFSPEHYILLSKMKVLSSDGRCKTFDETANGIASGEGVGILLLKPLQKALQDKDNIHAVIKGSAVNNDGRSSRFTTTNAEAQEDMLTKAFTRTGIDPETITYIETHGTGTAIGDPTEIMALKKAFKKFTEKKAFCALGSVKTNIGHLEPAAGIAGIMKTVMSLKNSMIPPSLHLNKVNHFIDIIDTPFVINDRLSQWDTAGVKRAGVSAFGMGGTNAHVIIEEAPYRERSDKADSLDADVFCISAKSQNALINMIRLFNEYLKENKDASFHEVCYTSNVSRSNFAYRVAVIANTNESLAEKLEQAEEKVIEGSIKDFSNGFFMKNSRPSKERIIFSLEGKIPADVAASLLKQEVLVNAAKSYRKRLEKIAGFDLFDSTRSLSLDELQKMQGILQMVTKYCYFKALMDMGIVPEIIVYGEGDMLIAAALTGRCKLSDAVMSIVKPDKSVLGITDNSGSTMGIVPVSEWEREEKKDCRIVSMLSWDKKPDENLFFNTLIELYINGFNLDWTTFYKGKDLYRICLPAYPFDKKTYRVDAETIKDKSAIHVIETEDTFKAGVLKQIYWAKEFGVYGYQFGAEDVNYYSHHRVLGNNIFPAAAYLDMAYRAGKCFFGEEIREISDLTIYAPLIVEKGVELYVRIDKKGNLSSFTISTCTKSPGQAEIWVEHAQGRLGTQYNDTYDTSRRGVSNFENGKEIDLKGFYNYFIETGIEYGKHFKCITKLSKNEITAISQFQSDGWKEKQSFMLNPSIVDAAFQTVVSMNYNRIDNKQEPFLPLFFKKIKIFGEISDKGSCYVTLRESAPERSTLKADVSIYNSAGEVTMDISGLCLKQASGAARIKEPEILLQPGIFYSPKWIEKSTSYGISQISGGTFLVFNESGEFGRSFAQKLENAKLQLVEVFKGNEFKKCSKFEYYIRAGVDEDYKLLYSALGEDGIQVNGMVYLWSLDEFGSVDSANIENTIQEGLLGLFCMFKYLEHSIYKSLRKFVVVTDRAWKVNEDSIVRPENSTLWGFVRVLAHEYPGLNMALIDLDAKNDEMRDKTDFVFTGIISSDKSLEVAYRKGKGYCHGIVEESVDNLTFPKAVKENGVYIITGGTGGIGLAIAEAMAGINRINIILVGRKNYRDIKPEALKRIEELKSKCINVEYVSCDVTDSMGMKKVITSAQETYGKIDGVFHTAGEIRDSLIKGKSKSDFISVILPKIKGTLVLQEALRDSSPDFIMLFSSISSVYGILGQSDYASANAFMDGLAEAGQYGDRFVSVNWSYWKAGMGEAFFNNAVKKGYKPFEPLEGAAAALYAAASGKKRLIASSRLEKSFNTDLNVSDNKEVIKEFIKEDTKETLAASIENYLVKKTAEILELGVENICTETSFTEFGMDSLLAAKLTGEINAEADSDIDATLIFDYPCIQQLSAYLADNETMHFQELLGHGSVYGEIKDTQNKEERKSYASCSCDFIDEIEKVEIKRDISNKDIKDFNILTFIKQKLSETLEIEESLIDEETRFVDFGMDSILAGKFINSITQEVDIDCDPTAVFDYPNLEQFSEFICNEFKEEISRMLCTRGDKASSLAETHEKLLGETDRNGLNSMYGVSGDYTSIKDSEDMIIREEDIAVIGMAAKFPGADTIDEFWTNLENKVTVSSNFPAERIDESVEVYQSEEFKQRRDGLFGCYLRDIDKFDPLFFEISPREAELMDPQQRLLLETVWQAFENAGYSHKKLSGTATGVYIGACITEYAKYIKEFDSMSATGNEISIISNRISYIFNLRGPSMTIDTACSSSLVALDTACHGILSGKCEMAVVGGVNLILTPWFSIVYDKAGMLSKDGLCKTFDETANGYVRGEGSGAVLLKPLKKAIKDRDQIIGVIKGTSINQDGHSNGITAPNALAQEDVIVNAWNKAGIDPRTISMAEAHGTGTSLGDPIEVKGLTKAFKHFTQDNSFCAIGSVKSNIGHLEPAAGISGVIKILLSMRNKKIPPSANFKKRNPLIHFNESPFYVNDRLINWETDGKIPRRAIVSSFGFGGTNVHAVIEEAPAIMNKRVKNDSDHLVVLSAKNKEAVLNIAAGLCEHITKNKNIDLANVCYTLAAGRDHYKYRIAYVVRSTEELAGMLYSTISRYSSGSQEAVDIKEKNSFVLGDIYRTMSKSGAEKESVINAEEIINDGRVYSINQMNDQSPYKLAAAYLSGVELDWEAYYMGTGAVKTGIPGYPLSRKSFWTGGRTLDHKRFVFIEKQLREEAIDQSTETIQNSTYLFFGNGTKKVQELQDIMTSKGAICRELKDGGAHDEAYYERCIKEIIGLKGQIQAIVHFDTSSYINTAQRENSIFNGISSLLNLVKALYNLDLTGNIRLFNITEQGKLQEGSIGNGPAGAMSSILSQILPHEFRGMQAKSIVVNSFEHCDCKALADEICSDNHREYVNLDRGNRLIAAYHAEDINSTKSGQQHGSVVIVTGGATGVGFEVSKHLSLKMGAKLVITGRSPVHFKDQAVILNETENNIRIANLKCLSGINAEFQYMQADVCDQHSMKEVFKLTLEKYGRIDAVIHCAGVIDSQNISIRAKSVESIKKVLLPKVIGSLTVGNLALEYQAQKVIFFSSLSAVSGFAGAGFSDYAASNAFMDSYAEMMNVKYPGRFISVNWPVWEGVGMSNRGLSTKHGFGLSLQNALEVFEGLFNGNKGGCITVAGNDAEELIKKLNAEGSIVDKAVSIKKEQRTEKPLPIASQKQNDKTNEANKNQDAFDEASSIIRELIKKVLKLTDDDMDDETGFNEYGIDSITMADLLGGIEKHYGKHLEPSIILEYPNIDLLAGYLANKFGCVTEKESTTNIIRNEVIDYNDEVKEGSGQKAQKLTSAELLKMLYNGEVAVEFVMKRLEEDLDFSFIS